MSAQTFVEADIWTVAQTDQGNVVLVRPKGSDLAVPIFIGQLETQSILIGLGKVEVPRPLTHDLAISLVRALDAEILRIEINDLREQTFFARIILGKRAQGDAELAVDSRPSDAIGLAVRTGCPVFIAESVVEEAGISVNLVAGAGEADRQRAPGEESLKAKIESLRNAISAKAPVPASAGGEIARLRKELEEAIAEEDYERAAIVRDKIKELEG
jgi:bifunctional DNase/RNase